MSRSRMSVGIVPPTFGSPPRSIDTGLWVVTYLRTVSGRSCDAGAPTVGTAAVVVVSIRPGDVAGGALIGAAWPLAIGGSEGSASLGDRNREATQPAPPPGAVTLHQPASQFVAAIVSPECRTSTIG